MESYNGDWFDKHNTLQSLYYHQVFSHSDADIPWQCRSSWRFGTLPRQVVIIYVIDYHKGSLISVKEASNNLLCLNVVELYFIIQLISLSL